MPPSPRVSVIIPVRNRRDLLRAALDSLDHQTFRDFETVVVDDGSTDGADVEAVASPVAGRPVTLLRAGGAGAVAARTLAVDSTTTPVLAFTDSDCEVDPEWLARAVARLDEGTPLVHGQTVPARRVFPLERSVSERGGGLFPTCNLAVTRDAYEAVGGFDAGAAARWRFRSSSKAKGLGFGEDTVFGWAVARRFGAVYEPEMLVRHHVFPADLRDWISRSWQAGAFPGLFVEVPELRDTLARRRISFGRRSRVPVYATVAATVLGRPRLALVALGWWAGHRWRHTLRPTGWPLRKQVAGVPAEMLLDAIQATVLVAGSVRARTILL